MERNDAARSVGRATVRLVTDAHQGMARAYDVPRVAVLRAADVDGGRRPGEIGESCGMAPSSVTRHVQALDDAGHVTVREDPADARTCLVEATDDGRAELVALEETGLAVFGEVLAGWDEADLRTLARLMDRLTDDWAAHGRSARRRVRTGTAPRWRRAPEGGSAEPPSERRGTAEPHTGDAAPAASDAVPQPGATS